MKKRKYRYDEGGDVVAPGDGRQDFDPEELAKASTRDLKAEISAMQEAEESKPVASSPSPGKSQTFKEAFAAARGAGNKTFEWQGKRYTTEMAGAKKAASAPAAASYSNEGRSRPTATTATAAKAPSSIYDTSRDPLLRKISESMKEKREAAAELRRESRRGQASAPTKERREDPYTGRTAVERMKDLRGYAGGGSVKSASKRADGIASRGKTRCKVY